MPKEPERSEASEEAEAAREVITHPDGKVRKRKDVLLSTLYDLLLNLHLFTLYQIDPVKSAELAVWNFYFQKPDDSLTSTCFVHHCWFEVEAPDEAVSDPFRQRRFWLVVIASSFSQMAPGRRFQQMDRRLRSPFSTGTPNRSQPTREWWGLLPYSCWRTLAFKLNLVLLCFFLDTLVLQQWMFIALSLLVFFRDT